MLHIPVGLVCGTVRMKKHKDKNSQLMDLPQKFRPCKNLHIPHARIHAYTHTRMHGVTLLYVYMHAEKFDIVCMTCHVILYNETHALKGTCMPISIKSRVYNKKGGRVIALCNSCHTRSQPFITYVCLGLSN